MKTLLLSFSVLITVAVLNIGGCAGDGTGIGGTNLHGKVTSGTTIDPTDPTNIQVNVGGEIDFAKRPMNADEKAAVHQAAFEAGVAWQKSGGQTEAVVKAKTNALRRLTYKYRIAPSVIKPLVLQGFAEGAQNAGGP